MLSHNQIEFVTGIDGLKDLTKLSLAHNRLQEFPDLKNKPVLKELRLNDNRITAIPDALTNLKAYSLLILALSVVASLGILDLGNNAIKTLEDVAVLASMPSLHNLNLKGNTLTQLEDYKEKV